MDKNVTSNEKWTPAVVGLTLRSTTNGNWVAIYHDYAAAGEIQKNPHFECYGTVFIANTDLFENTKSTEEGDYDHEKMLQVFLEKFSRSMGKHHNECKDLFPDEYERKMVDGKVCYATHFLKHFYNDYLPFSRYCPVFMRGVQLPCIVKNTNV